MKILYVITKSNFGGAQRYVFELAKATKEKGFAVAVASGENGLLVEMLETEGIQHFPVKNFQRDINPFREFLALLELIKIVRNYSPSTLHVNSSKAGLLGVLVGRLTGIKNIIFTVHGWPFLEDRAWWWKKVIWTASYFTALLAHKVILVSENDMSEVMSFGIKKKCRVIHNGVPDIKFKSREQARSELLEKSVIDSHKFDTWLITSAELNPNKNQAIVIDAVAEYNQENRQKIFYCLMSDGQQYNELQKYVEDKGLNEYVKLLGYIENSRAFLKAFDIFILPSKKEGLPYALLEAGMAEMPVIASNIGGIPEIIANNNEGLLIDPNSQETVVNALHTMISQPDLRNQFSIALKQKVDSEFTLSKMIAETEKLYT